MNPLAQYQQAQIETASKERILVLLFDGMIRFATLAKKALETGDLATLGMNCIKVQNIVTELMATLDDQAAGEMGENLMRLYEFIHHSTVQANLERNAKYLDDALEVIRPLRETWGEAVKLAAQPNAQVAVG